MTQTRGHIRGPNLGLGSASGSDDYLIPWVETDPARAPLRNDVISSLQIALSPALFWFVFFTGYYPTRTAVGAAIVMMLMVFGVAFTVTWARMASARRPRATLRSPRRKARIAVPAALIAGALTTLTSAPAFPDRTTQLLLGITAGLGVALIVLVLERYAVSVPAIEVSRRGATERTRWT